MSRSRNRTAFVRSASSLLAVSDHARMRKQSCVIKRTHSSYDIWTELEKCTSQIPAPSQRRYPTQTRLHSVRSERFEQRVALSRRNAPFEIVITDVK